MSEQQLWKPERGKLYLDFIMGNRLDDEKLRDYFLTPEGMAEIEQYYSDVLSPGLNIMSQPEKTEKELRNRIADLNILVRVLTNALREKERRD